MNVTEGAPAQVDGVAGVVATVLRDETKHIVALLIVTEAGEWFELVPDGDGWRVRTRAATKIALVAARRGRGVP